MTSKNSFWASIKENNKRRIWLWLVSALMFVIAFPTAVAMDISRGKSNETYLIESLGEVLGREALHEDLLNRMMTCFGVENYVLLVAVCAVAVLSAIQGFSYLYNKRKIDFYLGMPVKRNRRFLTVWLNGILVYLLPCLTGTLLGWMIAGGNGIMTPKVLQESVLAFGMMFCLYLGVYHLTILSVMLTGNVVITCFGTGILCLYELGIRILLSGYSDKFFKTFVYQDDMIIPLFSPFSIYVKYVGKHAVGMGNGVVTSLSLLGFSAVIGIVAYCCYLKRPAEAAGKAMAFKAPQSLIKILIAVPVTLLAGFVVSDIVGYDPQWREGGESFVIFSMLIVLVVICCLIQVIYEFDLRGIFHKKHHILISAAAVTFVFLVFRFDAFGYDRYLPGVEQVSSAAIVTPYEYNYYDGNNYFDENLDYVTKEDYIMDHMYLTDIGAVNKLLKNSNDDIAECKNLQQLFDDTENGTWYTIKVIYRMSGKKTVSRKIYVNMDDPETMELLDRVQDSEEYTDGAYISVADDLDNMLANETDKVTASYGSNVYYQKLSREEASELLALYKEDVKGQKFSEMRNSIPTGSLRLTVEKKKKTYTTYRESEIKIYPFYTRCVEYLKEHGYYMEDFLDPADVEKIQVTNYNYDIQKAEMEKGRDLAYDYGAEELLEVGAVQEYSEDASEYIRNAVYDDEEDIREICKMIYPVDWVYTGWSMAAECEENYSVVVYFKPEKNMDGMGIGNFVFLTGEIPEFVRKDTIY